MEFYLMAVGVLISLAIFDLVVGVSNDAVNFLNSSIGSRVAKRRVIMIVASLGIMVGVLFSSGMMEVARKGIFHPQFFTMPELITIFLAVMITDVILLDLFNTYGLPTSTTVSIVFELLGGAVAVSTLKILQAGDSMATLSQYINSEKAMIIIFGILLSVVVSFLFGMIMMFLTRMLFTFDYTKRLKRYGALWGGMALAFITYFILVKGAKGASFISPEEAKWIRENAFIILLGVFGVSAVLLQVLQYMKINILKPIVLVGTFALAMAFAANDLMNFIGVPMAGLHAYKVANLSGDPLATTMGALDAKVPAESYMLLIAGVVMVITLWFSKKARTVTETEISLGQQSEDEERFESAYLSRVIVKMVIRFSELIKGITPNIVLNWLSNRFDTSKYKGDADAENRPSFDLLRASVNMMVASVVISYATSQKLPLSTTYVMFMVAMGSAFSDLAWGRESAVYRITGVLTVVGGWFMTALSAFVVSSIIAMIIFYTGGWGVLVLVIMIALFIRSTHSKHKERKRAKDKSLVFNLKKCKNVDETVSLTFEHMSILLHEIRVSIDSTLTALYNQNEYVLKDEYNKSKTIQKWTNTIVANVFKSMRLVQQEDGIKPNTFGKTVTRLQKLADGHRDITHRAYSHVQNHHKGLLDSQVRELRSASSLMMEILENTERILDKTESGDIEAATQKYNKLKRVTDKQNQDQIDRIKTLESKTRLSILYYSIMGNTLMLSRQNLKLMEIFSKTFSDINESVDFD